MKALICFGLGLLLCTAARSNPPANLVKGSTVAADKAYIVAGPMLGYVEHREAVIWVQLNTAADASLHLLRQTTRNGKTELLPEPNHVTQKFLPGKDFIYQFVLGNLDMGTTYQYEIWIGKTKQQLPNPAVFKTKTLWEHRSDPPDFSFVTGSCLYVNDSVYDRPGKPYGQGTEILQHMAESKADFMLWLGDNTYTREADYSSASGLHYRYAHTRQDANLQKLLAVMPHYATWDDHDFGPNNSGHSYELKDETRRLFMNYWPARSYGENNQGIYTRFQWGDAEFFMLDGRYFRDETDLKEELYPGKTMLGQQQLRWFKSALKNSTATFKFVVVGGQFLNAHTNKESFMFYKHERQEILDFISDQKISGVVFITGDRHHTELLQSQDMKPKLGYELFDLTCSPLSSGANTGILNDSLEKDNPQRLPGTLLADQNYCQLFLSGKRGQRQLLIKCFDKTGALRWEYTLKASDLKAVRP